MYIIGLLIIWAVVEGLMKLLFGIDSNDHTEPN